MPRNDSAEIINFPVNPSHNIKAAVIWFVACDVYTALIAFFTALHIEWFFYTRLAVTAAFIFLGILHNYFLQRGIAVNKFRFTLLGGLQIMLIAIACYLIKAPSILLFAFVNTASFLLPAFVSFCWNSMLEIPIKKYKVWFNEEESIDKKISIYLNSIPVQIRVTSRYFDIQYRSFYINLPGQTKWGRLFDKFLFDAANKTEEPLEITDETGEPYGWQFTAEKPGSVRKKFVDPELDLRENHIHDNMIITAKRVKKFERILEYK